MPVEPQPIKDIEIFCSYAHEDEGLREKLIKHLSALRRQYDLENWHDRQIKAGENWKDKIDSHLNSAHVILLLISSDFLDSDYCYEIEMKRALERYEQDEAHVISIILRPCDWEETPFAKLQVLPVGTKAITKWSNRDDAFTNVVKGIREVVEELVPPSPPDEELVPPSLPEFEGADMERLVIFPDDGRDKKITRGSGHKASVPPPAAERSSSPSTIPRPPAVGFVPRRTTEGGQYIVERLKDELAPHKGQLVALWGAGGIGKTTLAAEAARELSADFDRRIVWTSALSHADFTFSTLLDEIATQLGREDLRTLLPALKAEQVSELVAAQPTLVVLDNFETISPDEQARCVNWLKHQATCPALITTRQKIDAARNIPVDSLLPDEAREFLERLIAQAQDKQVFATEEIRARIIHTSESNPFVMEWVVAQIDAAEEPEAVLEDLAHGEGKAAVRVFERSFNLPQLGDDGRAALLALSLFAPDASRPALAEVAGFGDNIKRLREAVRRLSALRLITTRGEESQRLAVEGLTRSLTIARLDKDPDAPKFRERFVAHFLRYAGAHAQPTPEDYDALEAERDNVLNAMDVAFALKDWKSVQLIAYAIAAPASGMLGVHGYWDEATRRNEQALEASRNSQIETDVAAFAHNSAMMHHNRGELEHARRLYDESLEINKRLGNQSVIASTLHELGRLAQTQGELEEARRLYNGSLEIEKRLGNQNGIAISLHTLGLLEEIEGNLAEAARLVREALIIYEKLGAPNTEIARRNLERLENEAS